MRRFFSTILSVTALAVGAAAAQAPVRQDPAEALNPGKMTVLDCLQILGGLNEIDSKRQVVINAGKPNEQVVELVYEFGNGRLRQDLARNIALLSIVQRDSEAARQKVFAEVAKGAPEIKPGTPEATEYDRQMRELTGRPCPIDGLIRIKASELKLDRNEIRAAPLAAIDKILDK